MEKNLDRNDWLKAARLALLQGGVGAVRVEKLALDLNVTKGSFYWHFKDREELLEALLREWEDEKQLVFDLLENPDLRTGLRDFFRELERRVTVSERGEWPSDAAIFAWAAVSPGVARRANKEEAVRIRLLKKWCRNDDIA
jgi:AcrR family transcriptional regulator